MQSEYEGLFDAVESFFYSRGETVGQRECTDESLMPIHKAYMECVDAADAESSMVDEDDKADWGLSDD